MHHTEAVQAMRVSYRHLHWSRTVKYRCGLIHSSSSSPGCASCEGCRNRQLISSIFTLTPLQLETRLEGQNYLDLV